MTHSTKRDKRDEPPDTFDWLSKVWVIDAEVGVYLSPSFNSDTTSPTFWHWCTAVSVGPRWLAMGTPQHSLLSTDPWHLEPSLLCLDCQLHGWIRDGRWIST